MVVVQVVRGRHRGNPGSPPEQTLRKAKQCAQDQMTSNGRNKIQIRVCPLDSFFQLLFPKVVSIKHKSEKMLPETKSKWSKWLDY